jgi:DNA-binding SARP family transcriptional activator
LTDDTVPPRTGPDPKVVLSRKANVRGTSIPRVEALIAERLVTQLERIWDHRLGLIVAPPGAGKSTLLASFAQEQTTPVAWYHADRWDAADHMLVVRMAAAFESLTEGRSASWSNTDDVVSGIASLGTARVLLVIDDLHALEGGPAETWLEWLVTRGPANLHILAASRSQPSMNLSRLRLAGHLLEIGADDLRFRTWEVERLFRDFYAEPIPPVELARLARWTEGWVAGLQLFHLATRGRPADDRRRVLHSLGPHSRLAREYLAQNALDRVRDEVRRFLVDTSVLGRLSAPLCDRFLGRTGSEDLLEELERRCIFTTRVGDDGSYRYHEVFRSHLQGVLVSEIGEGRARARFLEAGHLFMADGAPSEALEAYVRAEAWDVVERLLGSEGQAIADGPLRWLSVESQRSLPEDAWLGLAGARRLRAEGRFHEATEAYGVVARGTRVEAAAETARRERSSLLAWLAPDTIRPPEQPGAWWTILRRALRKDPRGVALGAVEHDDAGVSAVAGICLLVAGDLHQTRAKLGELAEQPDAEGLVACIAQLARGAAALLGGGSDGVVDLNGAIGAAEGLGWEWLARVGRSLLALSGRPDHIREAQRLAQAADSLDDRWGAAIANLACAWGGLVAASEGGDRLLGDVDHVSLAAASIREFRALGAPVLQAWAAAVQALGGALRGDQATPARVAAVRLAARRAHLPACDLIAGIAEARWSGDDETCLSLTARLVVDHGLFVPLVPIHRDAQSAQIAPHAIGAPPMEVHSGSAPEPPASLRLLGPFSLRIGGEVVDLGAIRPRVRSLLYLLAMNAGTAVHREVIMEILWPDADRGSLARNLHVAVASLRRVLEPQASRGSFRLVLRDGEGYLLSLPPGSEIDVVGFEQAVAEASRAAARADDADVERWARTALDRYSDDLLPESGPADWVVSRRDVLRGQAVQVAELLARTLLERGDPVASAAVCASALERDRYHDPLWRTLIEAREASGDLAAAKTARSGYRRALAELGVELASGGAG